MAARRDTKGGGKGKGKSLNTLACDEAGAKDGDAGIPAGLSLIHL